MNVRTFFVGALLVAGVLPLSAHYLHWQTGGRAAWPRAVQGDADPRIDWPTHFRDQPLTQLPLSDLEERFARRFPGAIARFTDGRHVLIVRHVTRPTRQLHPAEDCFRAAGYRVERPHPMADDRGDRWTCFPAERDGQRVKVCERIHDGGDGQWADTSAWFWAAQYGGGPWWAITVVPPLDGGS